MFKSLVLRIHSSLLLYLYIANPNICQHTAIDAVFYAVLFPGMRVYVHLAAHLRGRVEGLCGNFDGDTENDFITQQGIVESTAELFGNSWKVSPSCPDVVNQDLRDPCAVSSE